MAIKSNFKNMLTVLFIVCLLCAAVLAVVYAVTQSKKAAAAKAEAAAAIAEVLPEGGKISKAIFEGETEYYEYSVDKAVSAYAVKSSVNGFGGALTLVVGVLKDGTIYDTKVLSHSETPGLGAKMTSDSTFINQWKGLPADADLRVKKDGGVIDAITASTITSRAYALAVQNARAFVQSLQK